MAKAPKTALLIEEIETAPTLPPPAPVVELTRDDMAELSRYLGRNLFSKDELMLAVQVLSTLTVNGAEITLEPYLLERLKCRCLDTAGFDKWLGKIIVSELSEFAGC